MSGLYQCVFACLAFCVAHAARMDVMQLAGEIGGLGHTLSVAARQTLRKNSTQSFPVMPYMFPQMQMVPQAMPLSLSYHNTQAVQFRTSHNFLGQYNLSMYAEFLPPDVAWLDAALDYANHRELAQVDRDYLAGTAEPVSSWPEAQDWENWLTGAMEQLPKTEAMVDAIQVDDHKGTPIGEGDSIALVAASVKMDMYQLEKLPEDFRSGLFAACNGDCATWIAAVRISHIQAAGVDLMRIALKIDHPSFGEVDLHFTETLKSFPIDNRVQLEAFSYSVKHGMASAAWKYPMATAQMGINAFKASYQYKDAAKKYGVLGKDYYSLTPYSIGGGRDGAGVVGAMKWRLVPAGPDIMRPVFPLQEDGVDVKQSLRKQTVNQVSEGEHIFNLEIQVATDPVKHPLNSASTEWDESTAPWFRMGFVTIPQQHFKDLENPTAANVVGSGMWSKKHQGKHSRQPLLNSKELLFTPGSDSNPHKPLGDVNAFRAFLYPHYDQARQKHLLNKHDGMPAKCPFASIGAWLKR